MNTRMVGKLILILMLSTVSYASTASAAQVPIKKYTCVNDSRVTSRVYVALLGLNDDDVDGVTTRIKDLSSADPKTKAVWIYDYSPKDTLGVISSDFTKKFNAFALAEHADEIIVFGMSAGGIILANSAHNLKATGNVELHTIASPLKGFGLTGFLEYFLGDKKGLTREIGQGFKKFKSAPKNFKVYHHKTVTDTEYSKNCGDFGSLCPSPKSVQNNNLTGSKEYYYPEYDHLPLMSAVTKLVIACKK